MQISTSARRSSVSHTHRITAEYRKLLDAKIIEISELRKSLHEAQAGQADVCACESRADEQMSTDSLNGTVISKPLCHCRLMGAAYDDGDDSFSHQVAHKCFRSRRLTR